MDFKKAIFIFLAASFQIGVAGAQNVKEDLKKINQAFLGHKKFAMKIVYNLYPEYSSTKTVEEKVGVYKKDDNSVYASYFGMEIYETKNLKCVVNHKNKTIIIEKEKKAIKSIVPDLDKTLKLCSSVKFEVQEGQRAVYIFGFKNYMYSKIELEFDVKTFLIKRVTYFYQSAAKVTGSSKVAKPKLEILFSDMDLKPVLTKADFSTDKYFIKKGAKEYVTRPAYRNYKLRAI